MAGVSFVLAPFLFGYETTMEKDQSKKDNTRRRVLLSNSIFIDSWHQRLDLLGTFNTPRPSRTSDHYFREFLKGFIIQTQAEFQHVRGS